MSANIKDRHLYGAGAAACAVCCAPPLLALLGIARAGAAATIATVTFAGLAFGAVVLGATLLGLWARKRRHRAAVDSSCAIDGDSGPVDVTIGTSPQDTP